MGQESVIVAVMIVYFVEKNYPLYLVAEKNYPLFCPFSGLGCIHWVDTGIGSRLCRRNFDGSIEELLAEGLCFRTPPELTGTWTTAGEDFGAARE